MAFELRSFQAAAIDKLKWQFSQGKKSAVIVAPTGAGKTIIGVKGICEPAANKGSVVWFLVPLEALISQTSEKLDLLGIDHGVHQASHWRYRPKAMVQVCSRDTIVNRIGKVPPPDVIIIDECHRTTDGNRYGKIMAAYPDAYKIGLTATPIRLDGKGLGRVFECLIHTMSYKELIRDKYLLAPKWYSSRLPEEIKQIKTTAGDYNKKELERLNNTTVRLECVVEQWFKWGKNRSTIAFTTSKDASRRLSEIFNEHGVTAECIDESTPYPERKLIKQRLDKSVTKVLCSVDVCAEGFDLPSVGCCLLTRPTKSVARYIQMTGRVMRPPHGMARDGEDCICIDLAGLLEAHGPIFQEWQWTLADRTPDQKREKKKTEEEGDDLIARVRGAKLEEDRECYEIDLWELDAVYSEALKDERKRIDEAQERRSYYNKIETECWNNGDEPWKVGWLFKKRFGFLPDKNDKADSQKLITFARRPDDPERWMPVWASPPQQQSHEEAS